jgi:hypothetical protein
MPQEHLEPLFDRSWLNEINAKNKLIKRAYELKNILAQDIWKDALRIYEAEDKYLNRLPVGELAKLVKDLERMDNRTS